MKSSLCAAKPPARRLGRTAVIVGMLAGMLGACSTYTLVAPGAPHVIDRTYEIEVGRSWSYLKPTNTRPLHLMTIDGGGLNIFNLATNIEDGDALIYERSREKILPLFRSTMSESEIVEFVADTQRYIGRQNVEVTRIEPAAFGSLSGVAFDLRMDSQSGLNILATGKAAIDKDRLYLLLFAAPAEYYYGREEAEIQRIFRSVRLLRDKTGT